MKRQFLLVVAVFATVFMRHQAKGQTWDQTGNSISATSVLGSTNGRPLRFISGLSATSERMRVDSFGRLALNFTNTSLSNVAIVKKGSSVPNSTWVPTGSPVFAGFGESVGGNADFILAMAGDPFNFRPTFIGRRSHGTLAAPTAVVNNDQLASYFASGFDGSAFQLSAGLEFYVDGAPSAGSVPTRLSFVTGSNGATRAERLKVGNTGDFTFNNNQLFLQKATGYLGVGTITPAVTLDVNSPNSFAAKINGATGMYMGLFEGGIYRGYLGSFAGAAEDVDFGTGAGNTTGKLHLAIQGVPKMTLDAAGRVGIGTTSPTSPLHVVGNAYINGNVLATGNLDVNGFIGFGSVEQLSDGGANTIASNSNFVPTTNCTRDLGTDVLRWQDVWACGKGRFGTSSSVTTALSVAHSFVSLTSPGAFQIGETNTFNLAMDNNEIQARVDSAANTLFLQYSGGDLDVCNGGGDARFHHYVGIGTTNPTSPLHVTNGTDAALASGGYIVTGLTTAENISIDNNEIMARNNGAASPLYLQHSGGNLIMNFGGGQVAIGTTTPATGYKLSVNGKIIATEMRVETVANWPDYVFGKDYKLLPLDELERKLNADKHLPGVPSASEMKANGIMVGEMQTKTMEKTEENTLYILQLNNKIKELEKKIEELTKLLGK